MIAMPDPTTFNVLPWRPEDGAGVARMFADVQTPERRPYEGDPRHVLRRAEERARDMGFDVVQRRPRARVLPVPGQPRAPRSSTRAATSTSRRSTPAPTSAATRCSRSSGSGIDVEYSHHEVGPSQHEIDMRYAQRAQDGRRLHDLPHHGQGVRAQVRLARDVHAQAAVRPERLRHAHAPVAVQGRPQRVLRRRRQVLPERHRQGVHRRPAPPRARDLQHLRPVGELLQAARAGLRGAGLRRVEPPQPLRARARPALPPRQGERDPDGAARAGSRVQPVPDVRGAAAGRARGHRARLRAARADGEEPLPPAAPTSAAGWASSSCRRRSARRSRSPRSPSWCCGRSASTSSTATSRSSARSGRTTASRSLRGSSSGISRFFSAASRATTTRRPMSITAAGTITDRTTNVSSNTPNATMKPICVSTTSGSTASAPNVPASTIPAPVMTAPVTASPRSVPSRVPCCCASSRTRAIRKML